MSWSIAVHGGAKEIAPEEEQANRDGCLQALAAGRAVLEGGGAAIDAVEAAIRVLEDLPVFNAGRGSALNGAGDIEMCSGLMDGRDLSVGAVAAIREVRHPVSVARQILPLREILLAGDGATRFAESSGAELCDPDELKTEKRERALAEHDTVGAIARDVHGNLAAGTSTGGLTGTLPGRVGDSPMPGCGYYADNHRGAVALTGEGEAIARLACAAGVMAAIVEAGPEAALEHALTPLPHLGGDGGGVAVDKAGRLGWWHNSPHLAVATATSDQPEGQVWLSKEEL